MTPDEVRIQPVVADLVPAGRVFRLGWDASYSLARRNERSPGDDNAKAKAQHRHEELLDLDATGPRTLDASARMGE